MVCAYFVIRCLLICIFTYMPTEEQLREKEHRDALANGVGGEPLQPRARTCGGA